MNNTFGTHTEFVKWEQHSNNLAAMDVERGVQRKARDPRTSAGAVVCLSSAGSGAAN